MPRPRAYLAGPMVFEPDPAALFARMKALCARHGLEGVSPHDNQVGLEGHASGLPLAEAIVRADTALMREVECGLFCLDGFRRGPEMDPGTAFEIGFMHALGKPLCGWTQDVRDYPARVAGFFAETFGLALVAAGPGGAGGISGGLRDPDGVLVHSEGCVQNAMAHAGITLTGGVVTADAEWAKAFEAAAAHLARQVGLGKQVQDA